LRFGPWPVGSPRTRSIQAPGGVLADLTAETVMEALENLCGPLQDQGPDPCQPGATP